MATLPYSTWASSPTPTNARSPSQMDILSFLIGGKERLNAPQLQLERELGLGSQGVERELGLGQLDVSKGDLALRRELGLGDLDLRRTLGLKQLEAQQRESTLPLDYLREQHMLRRFSENPFLLRQRAFGQSPKIRYIPYPLG